jgi:hypothetical protein
MPVFSPTAAVVVPALEHATSAAVAKGFKKNKAVRAELKESSLSSGATQEQFAMTVKWAIGAHRIFTRRLPARHESVVTTLSIHNVVEPASPDERTDLANRNHSAACAAGFLS